VFSRLVILGVMREIASQMEDAGVDGFTVQDWGNDCVFIVLTATPSASSTRVLEERLRAHAAAAFKLMEAAREPEAH